jgi:hypothetical protein
VKPEQQLPAVIAKISQVLATKPEYFVSHPAEMKILQHVPDAELRELARQHGWRVVRRVGGRQLEFYNDVTVRPFESARNTSPPA